MGSIWDGFGTAWGLILALLGASGSFLERSRSTFFKALVQNGLQEAFWIDFGRILDGFGEDFGRIWGGSWNDSASPPAHAVSPNFVKEPPRCLATPRGASQ